MAAIRRSVDPAPATWSTRTAWPADRNRMGVEGLSLGDDEVLTGKAAGVAKGGGDRGA